MANNMPDATGNMTVKVTGNYFNGSFGSKSNSLAVYYRHKTYGGTYSSWKAMTVTKSGNTYSATASLTGLDYQTKYVFEAYAVDALATVYSAEKNIKATPVFDWSENDFRFNVPLLPESVSISTAGQTDSQLQSIYGGMGNATMKTVVLKQNIQDSLPIGGTWFVRIYRTNENYGVIYAHRYYDASPAVTYSRSIYAGVFSDWVKEPTLNDVAPAGYGLGSAQSKTTDIDSIVATGWYYISGSMTLGGINANYWFMEVSAYGNGSSHCLQKLYPCNSSYLSTVVIRRKHSGAWQTDEVVNPPMSAGVEYRTTERYQGKAVYTKLVNLSTLPNATSKTVSHGASATAILRVTGVTSTGTTIPYRSGDSIGTIAANKTQIVVYYNYNASSATAYAQIWYTKD
jgi:hypothetical protein